MEQSVYKTKNGNAITDSLKVAKTFGKRHSHVLRDIRKLNCDNEFKLLNYNESTYIDRWNRQKPFITITEAGMDKLKESFVARRNDVSTTRTYIMEAVGLGVVKIGKAVDVELRRDNLQSGCPVPLQIICIINRNMELELHKRFAHQSTYGEWFNYSNDIREFVKEVLRHTDPAKACCMSLADQLVRTSGVSLSEVAEVSKSAEAVFNGMMRIGVRPTQLNQ